MNTNVQQSPQPEISQLNQQLTIQTTPTKSSLLRMLLIILGIVIGLGLIGGAYYLGTQRNAAMVSNKKTVVAIPHKTVTSVPTTVVTSTADSTVNWKKYTSSVEKASFKYPQDWIITKPAIQSNISGADQIGIQSPNGVVKISWVSALSGFGGGCSSTAVLGTDMACPQITIINTTSIKNAPGLFVVTGTITRDSTVYQPFIAVQDNTGLLTTQRSMGHDTFIGKNNGSLPEMKGQNTTVLFSTSGAYAGGPSLTQAQASAWFGKPEAQQAKQILLSLTYPKE